VSWLQQGRDLGGATLGRFKHGSIQPPFSLHGSWPLEAE